MAINHRSLAARSGDRQAESLDEAFTVTPETEVSFVKLLPLVGG